MDEGKDIGKDVEEDFHDKDTAPAEYDDHKSPLTHCETVSSVQDVQLKSKELEEMGLDMTIDNKVSVEHATVVEVINANMDSNMKVNANNIGAEGEDNFMHFVAVNANATDSVSCNARVTASNIEPDISVDAKMVADADMTADINLDSGPNAAAIVKHDANSETVAVHIIDGNENFDVDASTFADAETNENSRSITDISNNSYVRHGNDLRDGSSIVPLSQVKSEDFHSETNANENKGDGVKIDKEIEGKVSKPDFDAEHIEGLKRSFLWGPCQDEGSDSGAEEDQAEFMKELEAFFKERGMEFKPPKFYGEGINCLKLWRAVAKLGGYDQVTTCKLWRQVGESFKPPKTCTTVSWTFRIFYEKALLEYEKYKMHGGVLPLPDASFEEPPKGVHNQMQVTGNTTSGRALRDSAARAMQGWHSQRLLGNGEVGDPIIKDKNSSSTSKREKQLKRKKTNMVDRVDKAARLKLTKPQLDSMVIDLGPPADWVKVNVQKTKDCFEVYALVPGLLREEVRVQSDPAGRLVISGQPEHQDNPWGVTPF